MANPFYRRDVISTRDMTREEMDLLFNATDRIRGMNMQERLSLCRGRVLCYLFFEPSTRTRLSFEAAMASIGGSSIGIASGKESSMEKGESLVDTIRVVDSYSDVIVLRHRMDGSARLAAEVASNPVINAGSGAEEHPTQAMLDLYTILKEKGRIDGLRIGIVGDLKYSRTVYSLLYALAMYRVDVHLVAPPLLRIRRESLYAMDSLSIREHDSIDEVVDTLDVIYVTRIQRERFPDAQEYEKVKHSYVIDDRVLARARSDAIVLHPLPRVDEVAYHVDSDARARYFKQASYGKDVRAALLALMINAIPPV
ncbi:MAG: aspartate carbamoyltransferase [Candidatus Nitrosocaldus sp.]|nr:aspartate carbamoyltransferase [Candidatus Nitrosocaldus sp.]MDW8274843.1 aspartate carbamoyltransferase [Candidatus Nitrosocaldus sp.]